MPALGTGSKLAGVFAPISTPFAANEDVDHGALRFNLTRYAQSGILGYLALGSNGESRSLAEDEKLRVLEDSVRLSASSRPPPTLAPTLDSSCRQATSGRR